MTKREKIELQVSGLTYSRIQSGAYALILREADGDRTIPVIIGTAEAQTIALELRGANPPRPLTHTLFASVLEVLGVKLLRVLIYQMKDGVFYAYLYLRSNEMIIRVDARTSDAIALALHMNAPIYIYKDIFDPASIPSCKLEETDEEEEKEKDYHNAQWDTQTLENALKKAIEEEDYERAAHLRDLLKQQKAL